jgi:2-amino-4-hydroxy-6-hydroxymethyldihydropteridine diphosphokinase
MDRIFLLLGTNKEMLKKNLDNALAALEKNQITVKQRSKIHKTKPWGYAAQPDFLNLCVEVACDYPPAALLEILKRIEAQLGRKEHTARWGPRIIDIDILFYGDKVIDQEDLKIPHQEFFNRPFAIQLLSEIAPDFVPPHSSRRIRDYVTENRDEGSEIYCD